MQGMAFIAQLTVGAMSKWEYRDGRRHARVAKFWRALPSRLI
jgi:hypothetical protein